MVQIPPFPVQPVRRHWGLNVAEFTIRLVAWLLLAVALVGVLMVVVGVRAFVPIMRGGGVGTPRRW